MSDCSILVLAVTCKLGGDLHRHKEQSAEMKVLKMVMRSFYQVGSPSVFFSRV